MATISFEGATKVFPDGTTAVEGLDLEIEDGEFAVIVGPSGSGKSTALKMVAGLEGVTSGVVRIGETVVNDLQPRQRDVAMVFQNYALYPHMSVADNLAFALKMRRVRKPDRQRQAVDVARRLGIEELLRRRPSQLSGGQRQRVALGRAIVRDPRAFLMDEPLSNLDAKLRVEMRAYLSELHEETGTTTLYVTHDQTEALTMGDRVAVMQGGQLEQYAHPQELYDRPANLFVAGFIGSPAMNVVRARLEPIEDAEDAEGAGGGDPAVSPGETGETGAAGGLALRLGNERLVLPAYEVSRRPGLTDRVGSDLLLGIRPEALTLGEGEPPPGQVLNLVAMRTELLGSDVLVYCDIEDSSHRAADGGDPGEQVTFSHNGSARLAARLPSGTAIAVGQRMPLVVDMSRIHLFDSDTHDSLPVEPASGSPPTRLATTSSSGTDSEGGDADTAGETDTAGASSTGSQAGTGGGGR